MRKVNPLLTTRQASVTLRLSYWTLVGWRRPGGRGPDLQVVRVGRRLFYHRDDLAILQATRSPASKPRYALPTLATSDGVLQGIAA